MGYEIDFLPVGEGGRSGDAIALRYGDLQGSGDQRVVVIDGGFQDNGEDLVEHIREYYKTDVVDLVISTHPDSDHINGLPVVLEELEVRELWMHRPSNRKRKLERVAKSLENKEQRQGFEKAIQAAEELENQAEEQGISITEPFAGVTYDGGILEILVPRREFYEEAIERAAEERTVLRRFTGKAREVVKKLRESWTEETLTDDGETSANNNTSAVTLFSYDGRHKLFTADAGIPALEQVADRLEEKGLGQGALSWIQVPHHGSKRNVGPSLLDRILGGIEAESEEIGTAFVSSAPEGEPKHPSKKVTNAFLRRGYPVHATKGSTKRHHRNAPSRGWSASEPLSLFTEVEE